MNEENDYSSEFIKSLLPLAQQQKKIDTLMLIAAKIKAGMKAKGWNKSRLAQEMGITNHSIITKWLSGTNNFQTDTLLEIQESLGIELLNLEIASASSFHRTTNAGGAFINFNADELYNSLDQRTGSTLKNVLEYKNMINNSVTVVQV